MRRWTGKRIREGRNGRCKRGTRIVEDKGTKERRKCEEGDKRCKEERESGKEEGKDRKLPKVYFSKKSSR
jgi:hypothetical protein